tara:strand:+ start:2441 stop:2749 length:309 start_codon:yes stop_codon:yes gene_type:complete
MKIKKELKNATFEYDEEEKSFTISGAHPTLRGVSNTVELNKVYAFAFMRFVVRMAQRNWLRNPNKSKKLLDKAEATMVELEAEDVEDPDQMIMFNNEASEVK